MFNEYVILKEQNKCCQIVQISCMGIKIALDHVSIQGQNN